MRKRLFRVYKNIRQIYGAPSIHWIIYLIIAMPACIYLLAFLSVRFPADQSQILVNFTGAAMGIMTLMWILVEFAYIMVMEFLLGTGGWFFRQERQAEYQREEQFLDKIEPAIRDLPEDMQEHFFTLIHNALEYNHLESVSLSDVWRALKKRVFKAS